MPAFSAFSNILPDPINKITDAGVYTTGVGNAGPGFAGINFRSSRTTQVSRTNSGKGIHRERDSQYWSFSIQYNPMLRDEFDVVDAFLQRRGRLNPFFVVLPQYSKPRDTTFATYAAANTITTAAQAAGKSTLLIGPSIVGTPKFGDMLTITDPADTNHMKVYKVVGVETNADYQTGTTQPTTGQRKIHVSPPLFRDVSSGSVVNFINPKFRVYPTSDVQEHSLDKDGLYEYSFEVEEIQP